MRHFARSAILLALSAGVIVSSELTASSAHAAAFQDPPTLSSQNGRLDVLMIAAARPQTSYGGVVTTLWTYEICPLASAAAMACPPGTSYAGLGGARLAVQPGDILHIRLVNKLPPAAPTDTDHIADEPTLVGNPTNLHFHGAIVEPHRAVGNSDTYGDYVFAEVRNSANSIPNDPPHPGIDVIADAIEYVYPLDTSHPPGLYWYHPHLHGISLNQVEAGMAGPITVGSVADLCSDQACRDAIAQANVRHLVLQDQQVTADGSLKTQIEPMFCSGAPPGRNGFCPGQFIDRKDPTTDYRKGRWLHTLSGQVYPTIKIGPRGDVWRILNASGSRSYALRLTQQDTGATIPMQILSIDGVALSLSANASPTQIATLLGNKAQLMPCPGASVVGSSGALCASTIFSMPSSRVDVRIVRGDFGSSDEPATFQTLAFPTGDNGAGDLWPQIDLANVTLARRDPSTTNTVSVRDETSSLVGSGGDLTGPISVRVPGSTTAVSPSNPAATTPIQGPAVQSITPAPLFAITPQQLVGSVTIPDCTPLAPKHRRKILFGYPTPTTFGLGYVEVDENGNDIESTRKPIAPFDPSVALVCVPLPYAGGVNEVWEIQNLTNEDHNFHIHQTRFALLAGGVPAGSTIPADLAGSLVMHDNIPIPRPANAQNCDGTLGPVLSGACAPSKTFIAIPFRFLGDFVFHCHILEHEDGGMMARIRVVAAPTQTQ